MVVEREELAALVDRRVPDTATTPPTATPTHTTGALQVGQSSHPVHNNAWLQTKLTSIIRWIIFEVIRFFRSFVSLFLSSFDSLFELSWPQCF